MYSILSTCKGGGYMYCRTEPLHPNRNSKGLYPLHRVLMENKLGRNLVAKEVVHHINEDKNDNSIENLTVLSNIEHSRLHSKRVDDVICVCPQCGCCFNLKPSIYKRRIKRATGRQPYCSLKCSGIGTYIPRNK